MRDLLAEFEHRVNLDPKHCAKLLGFARSTYYQYADRTRPLPTYAKTQIKAVLRLTDSQLDAHIREVVYGD